MDYDLETATPFVPPPKKPPAPPNKDEVTLNFQGILNVEFSVNLKILENISPKFAKYKSDILV